MTHPLIHYRGYHRSHRDTSGMTALYPTKDESLRVAKAIADHDAKEIWANPVYVGPLDTVLLAVAPISYTDWRGRPQRKVIEAGQEFRPGDIMVADHQVTHDQIGLWLVQGKAVCLPVAQVQPAEIKAGEAKEIVAKT